MTDASIKIVAISGSGRTGSTLFSLLLTQDRRVFNLGQLRDLWAAYLGDAACSCQNPLTACPVYSQVIPKVFGAHPSSGLGEMKAGMDAFFTDAARIRNWADGAARTELRQRHGASLDRFRGFFEALVEVTGARTFVDTSKRPEMALAFDLMGGANLLVLNLVRDPRAVVCSWYKKSGNLRQALGFARQWAERQKRLDDWSGALGASLLTVRYEAFAAEPRDVIANISIWVGLPQIDGMFTAPNAVMLSWERQHLYPRANERVLTERKTKVAIQPSNDWRATAQLPLHILAWLYSGPLGRAYTRGPSVD